MPIDARQLTACEREDLSRSIRRRQLQWDGVGGQDTSADILLNPPKPEASQAAGLLNNPD
jgi:hypothetical protein